MSLFDWEGLSVILALCFFFVCTRNDAGLSRRYQLEIHYVVSVFANVGIRYKTIFSARARKPFVSVINVYTNFVSRYETCPKSERFFVNFCLAAVWMFISETVRYSLLFGDKNCLLTRYTDMVKNTVILTIEFTGDVFAGRSSYTYPSTYFLVAATTFRALRDCIARGNSYEAGHVVDKFEYQISRQILLAVMVLNHCCYYQVILLFLFSVLYVLSVRSLERKKVMTNFLKIL